MIVVFFQDLDLWKQDQRNQRLNIGKSEPNEINIKSTTLWISWKCRKGKLNNYDYELLLRSMMIAWAAWKGLHVANPWHADSVGRNVVYMYTCIYYISIYVYLYIYIRIYTMWFIYTVQVASKKIRCATKKRVKFLNDPIDHCFGCHQCCSTVFHRCGCQNQLQVKPKDMCVFVQHSQPWPWQFMLVGWVINGNKLPSYLFAQRWVVA